MESVLIGVRFGLAAILIVAAVAKFIDLRGARSILAGFRVPPRLAAVLAPLLPVAELLIGLALIPGVAARWGAIAAVAMFLMFAAAIGYAMSQGRNPDCGCFGQLHSAPAGGTTLARNLVLAAVAAVVVVDGPGPEPGPWFEARSMAEFVAVAAVLGMLALGALALRQRSRVKALEAAVAAAPEAPVEEAAATRTYGLPLGTPAPGFELATLKGEKRTLDDLLSGSRGAVLIFFDPTCGPCKPLIPHITRWQAVLSETLSVAVISEGTFEWTELVWSGYAAEVLLEVEQEVTQAYNMGSWPSAIAIGSNGRIAHDPVFTWDGIEVLIKRMLQDPSGPVSGPDDTGPAIDVVEWRGSSAAV